MNIEQLNKFDVYSNIPTRGFHGATTVGFTAPLGEIRQSLYLAPSWYAKINKATRILASIEYVCVKDGIGYVLALAEDLKNQSQSTLLRLPYSRLQFSLDKEGYFDTDQKFDFDFVLDDIKNACDGMAMGEMAPISFYQESGIHVSGDINGMFLHLIRFVEEDERFLGRGTCWVPTYKATVDEHGKPTSLEVQPIRLTYFDTPQPIEVDQSQEVDENAEDAAHIYGTDTKPTFNRR